MIPENVISEIKYRTNIEQLIGEYVQLRRRGTTLVGLCPFHSEKTPSFTVWPQKGSYYCFGCGAGGDAITFIRQVENLEYVEALEFLAKRVGVTIPEHSDDADSTRQKVRLLELNRFAARFYHEKLFAPEGAAALAYLKGRRFSDKTIKLFGIGYAPSGWTALSDAARAAGFSDAELQKAFLASSNSRGSFDIFRNRVIFPMIDPSGSGVVAFAGRRLADSDSDRKYVNTNDTLVFKKSRFLYALNYARKSKAGYFILTEGPTDTISLHQAGFTQAVASQGTALTEQHVHMIARYVNKAVLCYDGDSAGIAATQRAYEKLHEAGISTRVLEIKDAKDPDEFIKKFGSERFSMLLDGSSDAMSYKLRQIIAKYDMTLPEQKTLCLSEIVTQLATLENSVELDIYASKAASDTQVDKSSLLVEIEKLRARNAKRSTRDELRRTASPYSASPTAETALSSICRGIVRYAFDNPSKIDAVREALPQGRLQDEFWDGILDYAQQHAQTPPIDIGPLGAQLSPQSMGRVSKMLNGNPGCTTAGELKRYTDALRAALGPQNITSDEDAQKYINSLLSRKKGGSGERRN